MICLLIGVSFAGFLNCMKNLIVVFTVLSLLASCSKENKGEVEIRVNNQSALDLQNVMIYSRDNNNRQVIHHYGTVRAWSDSPYQDHEQVSDFPLFRYSVDGVTEVMGYLRCGNGSASLQPGRYTLVLEGDSTGITAVRFFRE